MSTQTYTISSMTIQHSDVKKSTDVKNISIAIIGLVVAAALFIASSLAKIENETISMSMLVAGGVLFVFALYIIMNNNQKLVYEPTGSRIRHLVCSLDPSQRFDAEKWIDGGAAGCADAFRASANSNLRLDAAISADNTFAAVQLSVYENLHFVQYGNTVYLSGDEVKRILPLFG